MTSRGLRMSNLTSASDDHPQKLHIWTFLLVNLKPQISKYPTIPRRIIFFFTKNRILTTMIFESRVVMHIARLKQNDVRPEGLCFYGCQNRAGKCILPTIFHPAGQYECTRPKSLGYFRCPLGTASMCILKKIWISGIRIKEDHIFDAECVK